MSKVIYTRLFGVSIAVALSALRVGGDESTGWSRSPEGQSNVGSAIELQMSNVKLHLGRSVVLDVRHLRGQMRPTKLDQPITLDDLNSFTVNINSAKMAISTKTMSDLLNNYVFFYPGAPLRNIQVVISNSMVKLTGTLHKGIDLKCEIEGPLDVTPDGEIRLRASKIRSAHLPVKGLLHLFGEDLSKLITLNESRGLRIDEDAILLNPSRILPPPQIAGRVTAVQLDGDSIVETFGSKESRPLMLPYKAPNYIYHRGGLLRFGKLTMRDSDLEIVDSSPGDAFDFSLPEYNRQLVAGYSKTTVGNGLIVFVPDLRSLQPSSQPH